jgi:N-acetylmuramoyl-L-alanine amidase
MLNSQQRAGFLAVPRRSISAILFAVHRLPLAGIIALAMISMPVAARASAWQEQSQTPAQIPAPPQAHPVTPPASPQTAPGQNPLPPPLHSGPTIVINPAHGGTDNGARGQNGEVEKDVVLIFARMLRSDFERQGYRVVMTRNDDSNPSYEDRAAVANGYRDAIFISLHVSSTGKIGTVRAYSYQFATPLASLAPANSPDGSGTGASAGAQPTSARATGLIPWDQAQQPFMAASYRLADALQAQLAQRFNGSPAISTRFAVRELRSVAAPAAAVELSSVSVGDPNILLAMGAPLAAAIVRGVQILRPVGSTPANSAAPAGAK